LVAVCSLLVLLLWHLEDLKVLLWDQYFQSVEEFCVQLKNLHKTK
jgi:hypothetical protein